MNLQKMDITSIPKYTSTCWWMKTKHYAVSNVCVKNTTHWQPIFVTLLPYCVVSKIHCVIVKQALWWLNLSIASVDSFVFMKPADLCCVLPVCSLPMIPTVAGPRMQNCKWNVFIKLLNVWYCYILLSYLMSTSLCRYFIQI